MAVSSGMIYAKVTALTDSLQSKYNEIINLFDNELIGGRVPEIAQYYGGEAADAYKDNLVQVAERVKEDIGEIIRKIKEEADAQQQAYKAQDNANVANVVLPDVQPLPTPIQASIVSTQVSVRPSTQVSTVPSVNPGIQVSSIPVASPQVSVRPSTQVSTVPSVNPGMQVSSIPSVASPQVSINPTPILTPRPMPTPQPIKITPTPMPTPQPIKITPTPMPTPQPIDQANVEVSVLPDTFIVSGESN